MTSEHSPDTDDSGVSRRGFLARSVATGLVAGGFTTAALAQTTGDGQDVRTFALNGIVEAWQGVAPDAISGQDNPALELTAGETYRVIWYNGDGQPHNFAIQDAQGNNLPVLRPIEVSADQVTVFEGMGGNATGNATMGNATMGGNDTNVTWGDLVTDGNATMGNATMGGNDTNATGGGDGLVGVTDIVEEEGAVQAVEFEATSEMANYICTIHPTTMVGDVSVSGGDGGGNATGNST